MSEFANKTTHNYTTEWVQSVTSSLDEYYMSHLTARPITSPCLCVCLFFSPIASHCSMLMSAGRQKRCAARSIVMMMSLSVIWNCVEKPQVVETTQAERQKGQSQKRAEQFEQCGDTNWTNNGKRRVGHATTIVRTFLRKSRRVKKPTTTPQAAEPPFVSACFELFCSCFPPKCTLWVIDNNLKLQSANRLRMMLWQIYKVRSLPIIIAYTFADIQIEHWHSSRTSTLEKRIPFVERLVGKVREQKRCRNKTCASVSIKSNEGFRPSDIDLSGLLCRTMRMMMMMVMVFECGSLLRI